MGAKVAHKYISVIANKGKLLFNTFEQMYHCHLTHNSVLQVTCQLNKQKTWQGYLLYTVDVLQNSASRERLT